MAIYKKNNLVNNAVVAMVFFVSFHTNLFIYSSPKILKGNYGAKITAENVNS